MNPATNPAMARPALINPHRISPRASRPALEPALAVELEAPLVAELEPEAVAVEASPSVPPPVELGATLSDALAAAAANFSTVLSPLVLSPEC